MTALQVFANFASTTLAVPALSTDLSLTVTNANQIPTLLAGQYCYAVLGNPQTGPWEEVCIIGPYTSGTTTLTLGPSPIAGGTGRGMDGTIAQAWSAGATIQIAPVAQAMADITAQFASTAAGQGDALMGVLLSKAPSGLAIAGGVARTLDQKNTDFPTAQDFGVVCDITTIMATCSGTALNVSLITAGPGLAVGQTVIAADNQTMLGVITAGPTPIGGPGAYTVSIGGSYGSPVFFTTATDNTAALNVATGAAIPYTNGNLTSLKRAIQLPAGDYYVGGTVFIRKGQHLRGTGLGSGRIWLGVSNNVFPTFLLGCGCMNINNLVNGSIYTVFQTGSTAWAAIGNPAWSSGTTYPAGQAVSYNGHWWTAFNALTGTVPDTTRWYDNGVIGAVGSTFTFNGVTSQSSTTGLAIIDDAGGLPPSISEVCTEGGSTVAAVIDSGPNAGVSIYNNFITTAPIGVSLSCGDLLCTNNVFDTCATSILFPLTNLGNRGGCSRVVIGHNSFFWSSGYAIDIEGTAFDTIISSNFFNFSGIRDILVNSPLSMCKGLKINGNIFSYNAQGSPVNSIAVVAPSSEVEIENNTFRNVPGACVSVTGANAQVEMRDNVFDQSKTNQLYTQGTTMFVLYMTGNGQNVHCVGNVLRNLNAAAGAAVHLDVGVGSTFLFQSNRWTGNTSTSIIGFIGATSAAVTAIDNTGDNVTPMIVPWATASVFMRRNNAWLGPVTNASGKLYVSIPAFGPLNATVGISADTNYPGSANYMRTGLFSVSKQTDYNGSIVADYAGLATISNPAAGSIAPALAPSVTLDTVGGAASGAFAYSRYIVVGISSTNTNNATFNVDTM